MARTLNTGVRGSNLHREGIVLLRCENAFEGVAQSSGNEQIILTWSVMRNGQRFGQAIVDYLTLTEAAQWRLDQLFDALDAPENLDIEAPWFKGKEVYARIYVDTYGEEPRNKVKAYMTEESALKKINQEQAQEQPMLDSGSGAKARGRGRPRNSQPEELAEEEAMPI